MAVRAIFLRHSLVTFFALVFALTWLVEIPMLAWPQQLSQLQLVLGWMPGLAAVLVTAATGGRADIRALLRGPLLWRVSAWWYVVAVAGAIALQLVPVALNPLLGGSGVHLPPLSTALLIGAIVELLIRMMLSSEQLAWSGFALPRLQARHSVLVGSLALGVIWATWHLPLFFVLGSQQDTGFLVFLLWSVGMRVVLTWVFNNTGGSVLLVSLMHQATNVWTNQVGPYAVGADFGITQWLSVVVMLGVVAVMVLVFGPTRLSHRPVADLPRRRGATWPVPQVRNSVSSHLEFPQAAGAQFAGRARTL